ncbi:hypothetical protein NC652_019997 [Populus alba x Populus x berolinensis]|nr:hypothetical protein NC652_019997 [Populus alba x Populus x berolinensis]
MASSFPWFWGSKILNEHQTSFSFPIFAKPCQLVLPRPFSQCVFNTSTSNKLC